MTITKEIRRVLALTLTTQAMQKHAEALDKQVIELNKQFTNIHRCHLKDLLPGVSFESWPLMLQEKVANPVKYLSYRVATWSADAGHGSKALGRVTSEVPVPDGFTYGLKDALLRQLGWTNVLSSMPINRHHHTSRMEVQFLAHLEEVMPVFHGHDSIELPAQEVASPAPLEKLTRGELLRRLVPTVEALARRWMDILTEACEYHDQIQQLLEACRTRKQLQDLFPEAAELLPQPEAKKGTGLAPVELAAKVRRMLREGVPA